MADDERPADRETGISDEARKDRQVAEREVADRRAAETERDPHHELTNPATEPDATEHPDPYERRRDPRDPAAVDTPADPAEAEAAEEHDPAPQDPSTSEPQPPRNIDRAREGEGRQ